MRYLAFSFCLLLVGCGSKMPPITHCLYDKPREVAHCTGRDGKDFDCAFSQAVKEARGIELCPDKLIMIPFQDFGVVLDYCSALKKKN